jgi:hypothetical protein
MHRETIQRLLSKRPFEPFQIELSSGQTHEVLNPEFAFLLRSTLVIGYPGTDHVTFCSLLHITSAGNKPDDGTAAQAT